MIPGWAADTVRSYIASPLFDVLTGRTVDAVTWLITPCHIDILPGITLNACCPAIAGITVPPRRALHTADRSETAKVSVRVLRLTACHATDTRRFLGAPSSRIVLSVHTGYTATTALCIYKLARETS